MLVFLGRGRGWRELGFDDVFGEMVLFSIKISFSEILDHGLELVVRVGMVVTFQEFDLFL